MTWVQFPSLTWTTPFPPTSPPARAISVFTVFLLRSVRSFHYQHIITRCFISETFFSWLAHFYPPQKSVPLLFCPQPPSFSIFYYFIVLFIVLATACSKRCQFNVWSPHMNCKFHVLVGISPADAELAQRQGTKTYFLTNY